MIPSPPLGWLLTSESRSAMDEILLGFDRADFQAKYGSLASSAEALNEYLTCFDEVQGAISRVLALLRSPRMATAEAPSREAHK